MSTSDGSSARQNTMIFGVPSVTAIPARNMRLGERMHDLRHAAATLMLRDGLPVTEVSAVLGHAQTSTTLNVYAHALPDKNARVAAAMERLLG
jgi:integrase